MNLAECSRRSLGLFEVVNLMEGLTPEADELCPRCHSLHEKVPRTIVIAACSCHALWGDFSGTHILHYKVFGGLISRTLVILTESWLLNNWNCKYWEWLTGSDLYIHKGSSGLRSRVLPKKITPMPKESGVHVGESWEDSMEDLLSVLDFRVRKITSSESERKFQLPGLTHGGRLWPYCSSNRRTLNSSFPCCNLFFLTRSLPPIKSLTRLCPLSSWSSQVHTSFCNPWPISETVIRQASSYFRQKIIFQKLWVRIERYHPPDYTLWSRPRGGARVIQLVKLTLPFKQLKAYSLTHRSCNLSSAFRPTKILDSTWCWSEIKNAIRISFATVPPQSCRHPRRATTGDNFEPPFP